MSRSPKIIVVILNIAGMKVIGECLHSLDRATYRNMQLVIVCNRPCDGELSRALHDACAKVGLVHFTGFNAGFAAANNQGIKLALSRGADHVLVLNDDTVVADDLVEKLVEAACQPGFAGMVGPRIFYLSDPDRIWFSGARFDRDQCAFSFPGADRRLGEIGDAHVIDTDFVTGCCLLAGRQTLEKVGLLDERFFLYFEDADWGLRCAAAGMANRVVPAARLWHRVSFSCGGNDSAFKIYHKARSRLVFTRKHAPERVNWIVQHTARDVAWLLFKSGQADRIKKAAALIAGTAGYFAGTRGPGPAWLNPTQVV